MACLLPAAYVLFVWWFSTGLILYLDRRPRRTHRYTVAFATTLLACAVWGLYSTRNDLSVAGTYAGFTYAMLIWAWQEVVFLMGPLTGPGRLPRAPELRGVRLFLAAAHTLLYHELTLVLCGAMIALTTWGGRNQVALGCFVVLWLMRLSAKFNLFLGVRNRSQEFLPEHLRYLQTYFGERHINLLWPWSMAGASAVAILGWSRVMNQAAADPQQTAVVLISTLLSLGILEHLFMVLPLPASAPWAWLLSEARKKK